MDGELSSDLSDVKVGDWICTCKNGWTRVTHISSSTSEECPIMTESGLTYTIDGKSHEKDSIPVAFSHPPDWLVDMVGPRPCKFKKGDKVLVGDSKITWSRRYFSHLDAAGRFCCFIDGKDEWSSYGKTKQWKNCKKFELK